MTKILIIAGGTHCHRGERAILAGNIKLIKTMFPSAEIWMLSRSKERDEKWLGINVVQISNFRLDLFNLLKRINLARKSDFVFFGGGELLTGESMFELGLWAFWLAIISLVNQNIYGLFQGIGPTKIALGKKLTVFVANRTKIFFVRDVESKRRLMQWGVKTSVVAAHDPAILEESKKPSQETLQKLKGSFNIDGDCLKNFIGISPCNSFDINQQCWIPSRYKLPWSKSKDLKNRRVQKQMAKICDYLIETFHQNIIFFPMVMKEDADVCRTIINYMHNQNNAYIIDKDIFGPAEFLNIIGMAKIFISIRLHAAILATTGLVPSFTLYYLPKGRIYFEQIGCEEFAMPVEKLFADSELPFIKEKLSKLFHNREEVKILLSSKLSPMRRNLYETFSCIRNEI